MGRVRVEGSVLDELGFSAQHALELKVKAAIHQGIMAIIARQRYSARDLEKIFDVPQPRVSELTRGKLSTLSVGRLVWYADRLRATVTVKVSRLAS